MSNEPDIDNEAHRQLEYERDLMHAVFEAVGTGLLIADRFGMVTEANAEAVRLLGDAASLVGQPLASLLKIGPSEQAAAPLLDSDWLSTMTVRRRWRVENVRMWPKAQESFPADCLILPVSITQRSDDPVDDEHANTSIVVVLTDNTAREAARAGLEWQATHDVLTGLSNRALFIDRLQHALALAPRSGLWPTLMYLDLDRFKSVNDQLGPSIADCLLVEAARRIERSIRGVDTVARISGDEFVILCEALERPDIAEQIAARILHGLEEPFDFGGEQVQISASIGIVRADQSSGSANDLITNADLAMYRAKANGRNRIETYDAAMRVETRRRVDLERALREALDNDQLSVVYQPIFNTDPGALVAFEALARWHHPDFGNVAPIEFIALAEETGLISAVGERVLDIACRDAASWKQTARFTVGLHVNVSGRQVSQSAFVSYLARVLRHYDIEPSSLTLEMTESVLLDNPDRAAARLMALRELGIRVAIDDFGVGYSSLASLRRFPLDVLKVDRQFVAGIAQSPSGQHILQAIVDEAAGLDYAVIAEGVEQMEELVLLRELGFKYAQGYLLASPMPPAEALLLAAASSIPEAVDPDR